MLLPCWMTLSFINTAWLWSCMHINSNSSSGGMLLYSPPCLLCSRVRRRWRYKHCHWWPGVCAKPQQLPPLYPHHGFQHFSIFVQWGERVSSAQRLTCGYELHLLTSQNIAIPDKTCDVCTRLVRTWWIWLKGNKKQHEKKAFMVKIWTTVCWH